MVMRPALINVMAKACEKAGRRLVRDFGEVEHLQISKKGPADFVSTADLTAQKTLREELMHARPNFGFFGEEDDGGNTNEGAAERWIVDPIDGTSNFLHSIPHFAISIAVEKNGKIISGMIYNPITDEMFWAEKGVGAYCSGKRLRVSGRKNLAECLVSTGFGWKGANRNDVLELKQANAAISHTAGIRRMGSAALDLAYVAAGRYDAYWEAGLKAWDVAAGYIIVKEAGGSIASLNLGQDPVHSGALIATNFEIHDKFVKLIRDVK